MWRQPASTQTDSSRPSSDTNMFLVSSEVLSLLCLWQDVKSDLYLWLTFVKRENKNCWYFSFSVFFLLTNNLYLLSIYLRYLLVIAYFIPFHSSVQLINTNNLSENHLNLTFVDGFCQLLFKKGKSIFHLEWQTRDDNVWVFCPCFCWPYRELKQGRVSDDMGYG